MSSIILTGIFQHIPHFLHLSAKKVHLIFCDYMVHLEKQKKDFFTAKRKKGDVLKNACQDHTTHFLGFF